MNMHPGLRSLVDQRKESEALRDLWSNAWQRNQHLQSNPHLRSSGSYVLLRPVQSPRVLLNQRKKAYQSLNTDSYYTAITQRKTTGKESPIYDALIREFVPLPRLFDSPIILAKREYKKGKIDIWKKQVIKDVPPRPDYTVKSHVPPVDFLPNYSHHILKSSDPHFYEAKRGNPIRHYKVSPEWLSESVQYKTGPAYTSNIVFG